ncbi:hypothetical protein [Methylobacterium sp. WSM2598]|uniref:hypothetical protein n=1 Tax=Methylobacterium sp. WSM2598 TaxID=398261 RepID=UPI001F241700|nr:hypothetical protein [Methylobacterium sp. WSM2598]
MKHAVTRLALPLDARAALVAARRVPQHLLEDPIGRAWLAVHMLDHPTRGWDSADVDFALEHAHEILRAIGGRIGPRSDRGFWPVMSCDAVARGRVTAEQVSFVEAALSWLSLYVDREPEARALQLWCECVEQRRSFSGACKRLGRNINTEKTRRRRGSLLIAAGLCRDDVPIPAHVIDARKAQEGAERLAETEAALARAPAGQGVPQAPREPAAAPVLDPATTEAPPELWDRIRAALSQRRRGESLRGIVRAILFAHVRVEFAGQSTAVAEKRRQYLFRLARREGMLDDGGPR